MSSYYDSKQISHIERVVLAEDIILPKISNYPLTLKNLEINGRYISAFEVYENTVGKFFLNIMTPMVDKSSINEKNYTSPNIKGTNLNTTRYQSTNYISLVIPKYILLNFKDRVPKGTEFIIATTPSKVGNTLQIEDMRIIGLYSL